jgi:DNA invertase Pin-like site-specific DNA recombinase
MIRAAQYLRMSTEHQQYSLENQAATIADRAAQQGYLVVKTYSDAAKSGVTIRNRDGLKSLLEDVVAGSPGFDLILVYDVSRWGRFQDTDEAAHYEFLCKSAGVKIEYCAESFSNDSSIASSLMKALKRSMAAEYSRELSEKVRKGQDRLAKLGFWQGGNPGYGLRRMLVPSGHIRKPRLLVEGERKGLTDRVVIVPGPPDERITVWEIFSMFAEKKLNMRQVSDELNRRHVQFTTGHSWTKHHVQKIIKNPIYVGTQVYGRRKIYLSGPTIPQPKSRWTVKPDCLEPIVSCELFDLAQKRIANYTKNKSNEQIFEQLRKLWQQKGRLSREIIEESSSVVCVSTLEKRFGGLLPVYKLIGFDPKTRYYDAELLAQLKKVRVEFYAKLCAELPRYFETRARGGNWAPRLRCLPLNLDISVLIARHHWTLTQKSRWAASPNRREQELLTILLRLRPDNKNIYDIRVFKGFLPVSTIDIRPNDERLRIGIRVQNLRDLPKAIQTAHSEPAGKHARKRE